jgi:hypothetical protein
MYVLNSSMFWGKPLSSSLGVSVCFLGVAFFLAGLVSPSVPLRLRGVVGEAVPPPTLSVGDCEKGRLHEHIPRLGAGATGSNFSPWSARALSSLALAVMVRNGCSKLDAVRVPSRALIISYWALLMDVDPRAMRRTEMQSAGTIFWAPLSVVALAMLMSRLWMESFGREVWEIRDEV